MAQTDVLHVTKRDVRGTRHARRLRAGGQIPAIVYGHGEETVSISVPVDEIDALLRHGGKVVEMQGAVSESAMITDIHFDAYGNEVLHLDFLRVSASETVETMVVIELRGDAAGSREGGIVEHLMHELEIRCAVSAIPEKIDVSIMDLGLNESITVGDLELPDKVEPVGDTHAVVVQCVEAAVEEEEEAVAAEAAEPEVIGRAEENEEGEGES